MGSAAVGLGLAYVVIRIGYAIVTKTLKLIAFAMLTFLTVFAIGATFIAWRLLHDPQALGAMQRGEWVRALAW